MDGNVYSKFKNNEYAAVRINGGIYVTGGSALYVGGNIISTSKIFAISFLVSFNGAIIGHSETGCGIKVKGVIDVAAFALDVDSSITTHLTGAGTAIVTTSINSAGNAINVDGYIKAYRNGVSISEYVETDGYYPPGGANGYYPAGIIVKGDVRNTYDLDNNNLEYGVYVGGNIKTNNKNGAALYVKNSIISEK